MMIVAVTVSSVATNLYYTLFKVYNKISDKSPIRLRAHKIIHFNAAKP